MKGSKYIKIQRHQNFKISTFFPLRCFQRVLSKRNIIDAQIKQSHDVHSKLGTKIFKSLVIGRMSQARMSNVYLYLYIQKHQGGT